MYTLLISFFPSLSGILGLKIFFRYLINVDGYVSNKRFNERFRFNKHNATKLGLESYFGKEEEDIINFEDEISSR